LPQHLTYWIREQGVAATHVDFEGLKNTQDKNIWAWAAENDAIVISKDSDFFNRIEPGVPPRLIWVRWGNVRKVTLIDRLNSLWPNIVESFEAGEWFVELNDNT
jgi:predicted nuclease of predicted toxin-antitoxin system